VEGKHWEREMEAEHLEVEMTDLKADVMLSFEMGKAEQTQEIPKRQRLGDRYCW